MPDGVVPTGDGTSWYNVVQAYKRYAILQAGMVVSVVTLPTGQSPTLLAGQTAVASTTLQVGDRA